MHGLKNLIAALAFIAPALGAPADPIPDRPAGLVGRDDAAVADISAANCYILTNNYLGSNVALSSDGLTMRYYRTRDTSQIWRVQQTDQSGYYRLKPYPTGSTRSLDVINDNGVNSNQVDLAETGNYSGQFWQFGKWSDGTYRLSNTFTGPSVHLDVYSDTHKAFLGTDDHSGQHWHMKSVKCPSGKGKDGH